MYDLFCVQSYVISRIILIKLFGITGAADDAIYAPLFHWVEAKYNLYVTKFTFLFGFQTISANFCLYKKHSRPYNQSSPASHRM